MKVNIYARWYLAGFVNGMFLGACLAMVLFR